MKGFRHAGSLPVTVRCEVQGGIAFTKKVCLPKGEVQESVHPKVNFAAPFAVVSIPPGRSYITLPTPQPGDLASGPGPKAPSPGPRALSRPQAAGPWPQAPGPEPKDRGPMGDVDKSCYLARMDFLF